MKFIIKVLLLTIGLVYADQINDNNDIFEKRYLCNADSDCPANAYCFVKSSKTDRRWCASKGNDGDWCVYNSRCLSDHCHFWRCKGLQKGKDVEPNLSCSDSEDCRFEQYCSNKKCINRITDDGPCANDDQCLKNHCTSSNRCWTHSS
jgi:hypothetical protein